MDELKNRYVYQQKDFSFKEIVERLEKVFPEFDIGELCRIIIEDRLGRVRGRHAWRIIIAEKIKE